MLLCPDLQPGYVYPLPKTTQVVNLHRTRMSRPLGHAAPPSRPYHTSAYHAPESFAQSAVTIVQPKANADGASGSSAENNNGTSGGSSGNSGSGEGESSAHPLVEEEEETAVMKKVMKQ